MKITKKQLKRVIQEELNTVLNEIGRIGPRPPIRGLDPEEDLRPAVDWASAAVLCHPDRPDGPVADCTEADIKLAQQAGPPGASGEGRPPEPESWVGLGKKEVYDILKHKGAETRRRNPPWWDDFKVMDPVRVKFREWYKWKKAGGRPGEGVDQTAFEKAMAFVASLRPGFEALLRDKGPGKIEKASAAAALDPVPQATSTPEHLKGPERTPGIGYQELKPGDPGYGDELLKLDLPRDEDEEEEEREEIPIVPRRPVRESFKRKRVTNSSLKKLIRRILKTEYR